MNTATISHRSNDETPENDSKFNGTVDSIVQKPREMQSEQLIPTPNSQDTQI